MSPVTNIDQSFKDLIDEIIRTGWEKPDRTGTGTISAFGLSIAADLRDGFPLLGLKRTSFRNVAAELLWFLSGGTNAKDLSNQGVRIWDPWQVEDGSLGRIYGAQWRTWRSPAGEEIDQISALVAGIRKNPYSRRHVVSAWNVSDLPDESLSPQDNVRSGKMCLAPCHVMFQCVCEPPNLINMVVTQRSVDTLIGCPYNVASYALLLSMIAKETGRVAAKLRLNFGDAHIYINHMEFIDEIVSRTSRKMPDLAIYENPADIFGYSLASFAVIGYDPHPAIQLEIAV